MQSYKKLPVGIESFKELRQENFYYIDKTRLIEKLLDNWGKANLFTRPRRFGKTLNMSMLESFFSIDTDLELFEGLYISERKDLCEEYMGKFPVLSVSLKNIDAADYETARAMTVKIINLEARRLQFLMQSKKLTAFDKEEFTRLLQRQMDDDTLFYSLQELTELLNKHYGKKVILLIDEYDVPLAKANEAGYYDQMVMLLRNLFGTVLKTNENLHFAVLTGCLRVAKESIFTGLNNFNVNSITDVDFDEYFGFTDMEVKQLLSDYNQEEHYETVKEWYDGYRFGNIDVYCPWDVLCYCKAHINDQSLAPQNYWANTSGNDVIRHFIQNTGKQQNLTRTELERLISGETVQKKICQELTYKELYASPENIWSTLFMTGYLTQKGSINRELYNLAIPNREIRNIMTDHILNLFKEQVAADGELLNNFCDALENGQQEMVEALFSEYLKKTISIRDTFVQKPTKENFYHGILLGILGFKAGWSVSSNRETGNGYSDILIQIDDADKGIIIEVKYAEKDLEKECREALQQIQTKEYTDFFKDSDIHTVLKYGITCNRKKCRVMMEKEKL
ncbi:AAA family ATPase [Blautia obeum]|jgi:hypothetical protein|uniref:AAA family ATPase n=1 Tax=Blautia obeum TaxID=40520 RepID=UPI00156E9A95|nr:AAA family ATPase [Blautia obeum]NSG20568.1 AAA family ATPase [Blautia obeum]